MILFLLVLLPALTFSKIYERCELARELKYVHGAPDHQIATWVCIAEHESQYNTSIVGHLNGDGSGDHGLFQISDQFWCSPPGKGYACGITCAELEDDDISDDFKCAQTIYKEHKQLSGDGFNAWAVYRPHCKGPKAERYIKDCFNEVEGPKTITTNIPTGPINFAHGLFGPGVERQQNHFSKTTERTFNTFFTPKTTKTSFVNPTVSTGFVSPIGSTSVFAPASNRLPAPTPTSSRLTIFNPTRTTTTDFPLLETRSSFFNPPKSTFFTPTSSSIFFTPTTSTTIFQSSVTNDLVNEPIFIINGVKWY